MKKAKVGDLVRQRRYLTDPVIAMIVLVESRFILVAPLDKNTNVFVIFPREYDAWVLDSDVPDSEFEEKE